MTIRKFPETQALVFDLMGTCCDWHSSILPVLSSCPEPPHSVSLNLPQLAADWRAGFFSEIQARFEAGDGSEDIDVTHRRVLDKLLDERGISIEIWNDEVRQGLVDAWHNQQSWADAKDAILRLSRKFFVVVLANGTTRLQLDIAKSSQLPFHMLFSSQLLGLTKVDILNPNRMFRTDLFKPDPAIYRKALELLKLEPEQCIMVAAHAYDVRAAKKVGFRTVYIQRNTEDKGEDMELLRSEFDLFIGEKLADPKGGLAELADVLGA